MRLLLLLLSCFISLSSFAQESAYLEESHTLESVLETRARNILNTLVRPTDYTVAVSVSIKDDPTLVEEYQKEVEMRYLPGFPIPTDPNQLPANNKLLDLRSRVSVHLILQEDVPKEKDELIKDVLQAKLHLNQVAGDTLVITRSNLNVGIEEKPDTLPDLSWKMWSLIVLVTLLALAGLVYWAHQKRLWGRKNEEGFDEQTKSTLQPDLPEAPTSEDEAREKEAQIDDIIEVEGRILKLKEEILSIALEYPQLASKAVQDYFEDDHEAEVTLALESFGWHVARRSFPGIIPKNWGRIGSIVRERRIDPVPREIETALKDVYRTLISRVITNASDQDENNPFRFVFALGLSERTRLLRDESPQNLALISLYASAEQLSELLSPLTQLKQNDVIVEIARLQSLPESNVIGSAKSLKARLEAMRAAPQVETEGATLAADLLRSLPAEREAQVFDRMIENNPDEAERVRRIRAQFSDIHIFPDEVVSDAVDLFDTDSLVSALFDAHGEATAKIIGLLPPRKAAMVESDLAREGLNLSFTEIAEARRAIMTQIEEVLKDRKSSVQAVWAELDGGNEYNAAA